jgi:hypothetical protein
MDDVGDIVWTMWGLGSATADTGLCRDDRAHGTARDMDTATWMSLPLYTLYIACPMLAGVGRNTALWITLPA